MAEFLNDKQKKLAELDDSGQPLAEHHEKDTLIPTLLGYLAAAFVVAVLVVFGGRFIYHKVNNSQSKNTPSSATNNKKTNLTPSSGAVSAPTGQSPNSSPTTPSSGSKPTASNNSPTATPNPDSLPNSGPGQVASVFMLGTLSGMGLHYIVRRRHQHIA